MSVGAHIALPSLDAPQPQAANFSLDNAAGSMIKWKKQKLEKKLKHKEECGFICQQPWPALKTSKLLFCYECFVFFPLILFVKQNNLDN